jgi:hypothetical protein
MGRQPHFLPHRGAAARGTADKSGGTHAPTPTTRGFGPIAVTNAWGPEPPLSCYRATKLSVDVSGVPIYVRLSRTQPPQPPEWDDPIPVPVGYWSHGGPFGYFQFRTQASGFNALASGAAFSE